MENGVTLTIETGTELYFDTGVGMRIRGTLYAVVKVARTLKEMVISTGWSMVAYQNASLPISR